MNTSANAELIPRGEDRFLPHPALFVKKRDPLVFLKSNEQTIVNNNAFFYRTISIPTKGVLP